MNARQSGLRGVVASLKRVRSALVAGHIDWAIDDLGRARQEFGLTVGLCQCPPTAGLRSVIRHLGDEVERAAMGHHQLELADPADLVDAIATMLMVLRRRDAVDITDEQAEERARNITQVLEAKYVIRKRCSAE